MEESETTAGVTAPSSATTTAVDPVSTPTSEVTPTETTPAEVRTAETKPPVEQPVQPAATESIPAETMPVESAREKVAYQPDNGAMIIIPRDTELIIELQEPLDTQRNREGDKFTARVVAPQEIVGAIIEGRVDKIQKPGHIKKRSTMLLSFDRIIISEERWSNFDAIMTEVLPVKGDNVKRVDAEGTAVGKSTVKPDLVKVGVATGAGAGVGALTGGPVGAAVGAGVGAAVGVGAVIIERGKHISLRTSQQLRVKTSYETKIR